MNTTIETGSPLASSSDATFSVVPSPMALAPRPSPPTAPRIRPSPATRRAGGLSVTAPSHVLSPVLAGAASNWTGVSLAARALPYSRLYLQENGPCSVLKEDSHPLILVVSWLKTTFILS